MSAPIMRPVPSHDTNTNLLTDKFTAALPVLFKLRSLVDHCRTQAADANDPRIKAILVTVSDDLFLLSEQFSAEVMSCTH